MANFMLMALWVQFLNDCAKGNCNIICYKYYTIVLNKRILLFFSICTQYIISNKVLIDIIFYFTSALIIISQMTSKIRKVYIILGGHVISTCMHVFI